METGTYASLLQLGHLPAKQCQCIDPLCKAHRHHFTCHNSASTKVKAEGLEVGLCSTCSVNDPSYLRGTVAYLYGVEQHAWVNGKTKVAEAPVRHRRTKKWQDPAYKIEATVNKPPKEHKRQALVGPRNKGPWFIGLPGQKAQGPFSSLNKAYDAGGPHPRRFHKEGDGSYTLRVNGKVFIVVDKERLAKSGLKHG